MEPAFTNSEPEASAPLSSQRSRSGRSAPRSRNGCLMCKQRRVRCDEARPICGHCIRLDLDCAYPKRSRKAFRSSASRLTPDGASAGLVSEHSRIVQNIILDIQDTTQPEQSPISNNNAITLSARERERNPFHPVNGDGPVSRPSGVAPSTSLRTSTTLPISSSNVSSNYGYSENQRISGISPYLRGQNNPSYGPVGWSNLETNNSHCNFSLGRTFDPPDGQDSLGTFTFSDLQSNAATWNDDFNTVSDTILHNSKNRGNEISTTSNNTWSAASIDALIGSTIQNAPSISAGTIAEDGCINMHSKRSSDLLSYFRKITQPPASILITGVQKWRRLQSYFVRMSHQHKAVAAALFAIIELLAKDDQSFFRADSISSLSSMSPALSLREAAQNEIELIMSRGPEWRNSMKMRDALLASIFLLAWFEVVGDQVFDQRLFPSGLADQIITSAGHWNKYSRQLLQWLNTLDCKSSHLGGQHLLSQRALKVVSEHHTQISMEDSSSEDHVEERSPGDGSVFSSRSHDNDTSSVTTPHSDTHGRRQSNSGSSPQLQVQNHTLTSIRQMKLAVLNTILQPALDWYLITQTYCRRIGSHDRHHRSRFTPKDEYEVVIACKRLELELIHLWKQRPIIIRLSAVQLLDMVCMDIALRLEAIFSLYMASFWILFVYLHRVAWWHLPHSETTASALEETWKNLQRSFGEEVASSSLPRQKKVVHPALLWPLFMFGSECVQEERREWAVEQLEALGDANAVVDDEGSGESLPPFRLSIGATRNAKRAAVLLRELVRRQKEGGGRVDDKELSIELFGCSFSVI